MPSIREGSTGLLTGRFVNKDGIGVSSILFDYATLTLYDYVTKAIINGADGRNILNAGGATISSTPGNDGAFSIPLAAADNPILDSTKQSEAHIALLKFSVKGSVGTGEIRFIVMNAQKIFT